MSAEVPKFTRAQVEALELAPGAVHRNLEGRIPPFAGDEEVRDALDKAFDYRGDVTLTLRGGERVQGYVFNRLPGATLADSRLEYFPADAPEKRSVRYSDIARLEFSGKDCAAGKQWEDWVKKHRERKAAGEKGIGLAPDPLD